MGHDKAAQNPTPIGSYASRLACLGLVQTKVQACTTNLLRLARAGTDPFFRLVPRLVKREQPCLATTLDQLIGFHDKLGGEHPAR